MTEPGFEPARLRLARELNQWSQTDVATRVAVTPAAIGQFESGTTRPSRETVESLARVLGVPSAFLGLPIVETHDGFFRATRRTRVAHRRRARALAHIAHDLATGPNSERLPRVDVPFHPCPDLDAGRVEIEAIAAAVRREWGLPPGPVDNVVELLERHGVVVLRLPLETGDVDAFSLPFHDRPVVVLGADKDDRARSRFDAAHELGHLVMHGERVWGMKQVEDQAHKFAAAFLMPAEDIGGQLPARADWQTFFGLKLHWQVSLAALLMRAKTLERMTEASYLTAVKAVSARGWRRREPVPLGVPEHPALLQHIVGPDQNTEVCAALPANVVHSIVQANRS